MHFVKKLMFVIKSKYYLYRMNRCTRKINKTANAEEIMFASNKWVYYCNKACNLLEKSFEEGL